MTKAESINLFLLLDFDFDFEREREIESKIEDVIKHMLSYMLL